MLMLLAARVIKAFVSDPRVSYFISVSQFSSVQFSHEVVSDSLRPHGLQHARPPWPPLTPRVYSNSCHWVSDAIQPPHPLSSCPQSFLASGSFQMSQLFISGGQSIGDSASTSVLPMNVQDSLDLLAVQGTLKSLLQHYSSKADV